MAVRDLIPWGRQDNPAPAAYRADELSPFFSLRREVDRMFDDMFRGSLIPRLSSGASLGAWPSIEVSETDGEVKICAELPGLSEDDVDLTMENGVLTIRGEKRSETQDQDRGYSERFYGRFERRIALPSSAKESEAHADFENGVLTVTVPKSAEAERGRKIPIGSREKTKH